MDDSHSPRSESGFALIETIVAAAVLAIVALAVLSGIDAANGASAREKSRAVAASLAERDQERMRSMPYDQILKPGGVAQQPDTVVDGVTYKIQSKAELVTDDVGGTPECGDEGTQVAYVHITSKVTSSVVGKNIKPVEVDSLVPPTQKWAEGHGTLGVKVVDRTATQGVRNLAVSATSTAYTPPASSTDANGCVVFKDVPIGSYTITVNSPGYIDREGKAISQTTANVVAKKVVFATMSYDVADKIDVEVKTHTPGKSWSDPAVHQATSKGHKISLMNGANVGMLRTDTPSAPVTGLTMGGLFPFAQTAYTFFTGGCRYMAPDQVTSTDSSTKLWPNYFNTTNPAASVLADPAVAVQLATVRQPPFNIRIESTRNDATFNDANMRVWATLIKPEGYDNDSCSEARFLLGTANWDATRFGTRDPNNGDGNNHWVTQRNGMFDPGMPFGTYTICLRDTNLNRGASFIYDNTKPDGGELRNVEGGSLSWQSGSCNY
jgi:type II secretory pathway pseudopilin PulG